MKEVRVIENSIIPRLLSWFINIHAITIYPFIICRTVLEKRTRSHEFIHIAQQKELWVIGFYVLYVWYWVKNIVWKKMSSQQAYRNIPFEIEAYENEHNDIYALTRDRMAWRQWT
tara:strand:+ start:2175 stop:2519 length:345 start_codon:yes stop_codon:yes gene_type:complete